VVNNLLQRMWNKVVLA